LELQIPGTDRYIYDQDTKKHAKNINAYLLDAQDVIVSQLSRSISGLPTMDYGNKPSDGGNLILSRCEKEAILAKYPEAGELLKKLVGSREFTSSSNRWCLWIEDVQFRLAMSIPPIAARIEAAKTSRLASKGKQSQDKADMSHRFVYAPHQDTIAMIVPSITSENREYLPVGLVDADTVISNKAAVVYSPPMWTLSIVASRLHAQWIGTVCVRMRTDFSYSNTLGWNTFPVPSLTDKNKADLTRCAEDILLAREAHFPATIADLYDPDNMPADLREAHERNDEVLERIYIGRRFRNDTERLEKLFELYTKMTAGQGANKKRKTEAST
jgi:MmeI, target recognition domain/MmeI, C-terminal domain